jgi:hypothetical protein
MLPHIQHFSNGSLLFLELTKKKTAVEPHFAAELCAYLKMTKKERYLTTNYSMLLNILDRLMFTQLVHMFPVIYGMQKVITSL